MLSNTLAANNTINIKGYLGGMAFFLSSKCKPYFNRDLNSFSVENVSGSFREGRKKKKKRKNEA